MIVERIKYQNTKIKIKWLPLKTDSPLLLWPELGYMQTTVILKREHLYGNPHKGISEWEALLLCASKLAKLEKKMKREKLKIDFWFSFSF